MTRPFIALTILIFVVAGEAAAALKPARIAARITTGQAPCSESGGLGYLWVSNFKDGTVVRVDPATNRVTARIRVGPQPCGVVAGADALWVDGYGTGNVERVDPQTQQVVARIPVGPSLWDVEFGADAVWATSEFNGTVARIDPATNAITATIKVGMAPRQVRYGAGAIWVGNHAGRSIYRVDPATNKARAVAVGSVRSRLRRGQRFCDLGDIEHRPGRGALEPQDASRRRPGQGRPRAEQCRNCARRERLRPERRRHSQSDRSGAQQGGRDL
jgi:YVTN family beta-propeller protein